LVTVARSGTGRESRHAQADERHVVATHVDVLEDSVREQRSDRQAPEGFRAVQLLHARPQPANEARLSDSRRASRLASETKSPDTVLAEIWKALARGGLRIEDYFHDHDRYGLRLVAATEPSGFTVRERTLVKRYFDAGAQKIIGLEDGVSAASVSTRLRHALAHIGLSCAPSRMPLLLSLAAFAAAGNPMPGVEQESADGVHRIVTLHSPRLWLAERLSQSETEVALLRIQGSTQSAIAAARGRAAQTVANQIASVYRRLGVSDRCELVALLTREYSRGLVPNPTGVREQ
jgi:DNA-binding NarL/FixJ family response regulator